MKIAVHLARHRRLLALCGLSLLLHLLALAWIGPRLDVDQRDAAGGAITLRLADVAPPRQPQAAQPAPPHTPSAPASQPATAAARPSLPAPALPPLRPLLPAPSAPSASPSADAPAAPPPAAAGDAPQGMPGRYLVRTPPAARLLYSVSRTRPGRPPTNEGEGEAQIVWEADAGRYQLRVEGVLGLLESEGGGDDAGIAPLQASEHQDDGSDRITRFDRANGRIVFASNGGSAPLHLGSQDRASVLMQLAGIGLAQPEQMQDTIEIVVGAPDGAEVVRFQVLGREQLATGAGTLSTVRLAELDQSAGARRSRLELWLAPGHDWMPVQLRVTAPDGSVATQVVTRIETAPPAGEHAPAM
ncbi:DUF3108 domain-containing protein [Massilia haematophila]|uniref:DUF3108 domain-containing protein n=2 Tax=Massilia TaxID=149698 RepID=A0ABV7PKR4_9BURK